MNEQQTEPDWKALYLASRKKHYIGWMMNTLSEILNERDDGQSANSYILSRLQRLEGQISEMRSQYLPKPDFTPEQANLSQMVHTYFRKYDDSSAGTIIYRMVDQSRGMQVWKDFVAFVKKDIEELTISDGRYFFSKQHLTHDEVNDEDETILYYTIRSWHEMKETYYSDMVKEIETWTRKDKTDED